MKRRPLPFAPNFARAPIGALRLLVAALLLWTGRGGPARAQEAAPSADARVDLISHALEPDPGGLTAEEVVAGALQTSPRLKSAGMAANKAEQNHFRSKLAFAPRVDMAASYKHLSPLTLPKLTFLTPVDPTNPNGDLTYQPFAFPQVYNQYGVTGSIMLPITEIFLVVLPTYKGAKRAKDVAAEQEEAVKLQVSYEARVAFYEYLRTRGRIVVVQDAERLIAAHVTDLEGLVKAGVATETDLLRAQSELANTRAQLTELAGMGEVAVLQLSQLVGSTIDPSRGVGEPLVARETEATPALGDVVGKAQAQRPELRALRTLIGARENFADAKRGAQWPQLRGTGNVYYANPNPRIFPQQAEFRTTWDVGVALTWSPNDYAYARTQASDADVDIAMVREDLRAMEDGVVLEAASAVTGHKAARERVAANIMSVDAARRRYEDQRALMLAGAATPNDVLEAENLLRRSELLWIDAFIHVRMAHAALLKAQGETGLATGAGTTP
jgi:outer membrane protein TolC